MICGHHLNPSQTYVRKKKVIFGLESNNTRVSTSDLANPDSIRVTVTDRSRTATQAAYLIIRPHTLKLLLIQL